MKEYFNLQLKYIKPPLSKNQYNEFIDKINLYKTKATSKTIITFLIVAYKEDELLFRLLNSILYTDSKSFEILIVDNGLSSQTKEKLKTFPLKHIILNKNLGCSIGRNIGSLYSKADILFFVDADGVIEDVDLVIKKAENFLKDNKLVAIRGKVVEFKSSWLGSKPVHYDLGTKKIPSFIDTEGVSLFKSKDFISVGGFEDGLEGNEGLVLCFRMVEFYNYELDSFIYDPEIILLHNFYLGLRHLTKKREKYRILNNIVRINYPLIQLFSLYYKQYRRVLKLNRSAFTLPKKFINLYVNKKVDRYFFKNLKEFNINSDTSSVKNNFTVVILCFNRGAYLLKAIKEVQNQTLNKVEIIVIDICSNDPVTEKILKQISNSVNLIKVHDESALKEEISKSGSEYICFLNKVDYFEPTYLEKVKNIYDNYKNVGIVSSKALKIERKRLKNGTTSEENMDDILVNRNEYWVPCFRKNVLLKEFNTNDLTLDIYNRKNWLRTINNGWKIKILP